MKPVLTVIGSGTLVPSGDRSSPCHLVEWGEMRLLLDVGPGAVHGLARLRKPWWEVSHVVLSHYHADHIGDLAHLLFALRWATPAPRGRPLHIFGPPGLNDRVEALRHVYGDFMVDPGFEVAYHEVAREGRWDSEESELSLRFAPTRHTDSSIAVRVEMDSHSLGYTGDTGPDPKLGDFFRGTDTLVSECGHTDPPPSGSHLSPVSVAGMARIAQPANLVLTHIYPPLDPESVPALVREAGYAGTIVCARDGQWFVVS